MKYFCSKFWQYDLKDLQPGTRSVIISVNGSKIGFFIVMLILLFVLLINKSL